MNSTNVSLYPEQNNQPLKFKGQPIITTESLAQSLGADSDRLKKNFSNNRGRYSEGEHYFLLQGADLQAFKNQVNNLPLVQKQTSRLYLWTEKGAFNHVKSLGTDQAWDAYQVLVDTYFRQREALSAIEAIRQKSSEEIIAEGYTLALKSVEVLRESNRRLESTLLIQAPIVEYATAVLQSPDALKVTQVASEFGMGAVRFNKLLESLKITRRVNKQWVLTAKYQGNDYTRAETYPFTRRDGSSGTDTYTVWTEKGKRFLHEILAEYKPKRQA